MNLTDLLGNNDADWMENPNRNCATPHGYTAKEIGIVADHWFPTETTDTKYATRLCTNCPVFNQCFLYAYQRPELEGIWGGTTTKQRATLRRKKEAERAA